MQSTSLVCSRNSPPGEQLETLIDKAYHVGTRYLIEGGYLSSKVEKDVLFSKNQDMRDARKAGRKSYISECSYMFINSGAGIMFSLLHDTQKLPPVISTFFSDMRYVHFGFRPAGRGLGLHIDGVKSGGLRGALEDLRKGESYYLENYNIQKIVHLCDTPGNSATQILGDSTGNLTVEQLILFYEFLLDSDITKYPSLAAAVTPECQKEKKRKRQEEDPQGEGPLDVTQVRNTWASPGCIGKVNFKDSLSSSEVMSEFSDYVFEATGVRTIFKFGCVSNTPMLPGRVSLWTQEFRELVPHKGGNIGTKDPIRISIFGVTPGEDFLRDFRGLQKYIHTHLLSTTSVEVAKENLKTFYHQCYTNTLQLPYSNPLKLRFASGKTHSNLLHRRILLMVGMENVESMKAINACDIGLVTWSSQSGSLRQSRIPAHGAFGSCSG